MPKHFVPIVATAFVMMFMWLSAVPLLSWYELSGYHQVLADAEFRWQHEGLTDYSFEFDAAGPGAVRLPAPLRIHVRDGVFVEAVRADNGQVYELAAGSEIPGTIDELFRLAGGLLEAGPRTVEIDYHPQRHYPTRIFAEFDSGPQDGVSYFTRSLRPQ